jgi:polysaccharide biosynthesis protein PslG
MVRPFARFVGAAMMTAILAGGQNVVAAVAEPSRADQKDPRDDASPWGVASGAEWFSAFPDFNPMLRTAGVRWLRGFYEWQTLQPKQGYWNWVLTDRLVDNARTNGIHVTAGFAYFASWASADGGTRKFPIKNMQFWRDYVSGLVKRYHKDIKYWEVWNEFNGSFAEGGTPEIYAEMVREASISAKKIDPTAKIGMSVANFDVGFLDAAIKAGASGHYDYICVHPYEKLNALAENGEVDFLSMSTTLRQMLAKNKQSIETPIWITEIGTQTSVTPDQQADARQAVALAKAYLLSIAAGFQRVFWFEARGPAYGRNTDHGLIRADFTPRPSYRALRTMSEVLGSQPTAAGWLNLDGGYGFLFRTDGDYRLAVWAPSNREIKVTFADDVRVADLEGNIVSLPAGHRLTLTDVPQLIVGVPEALIEQAKLNKDKPYSWTGNFAQARTVSARMQMANLENGVRQINIETTSPGGTADDAWRRTDFLTPQGEGHYVYFAVDPQFVPFGFRNLEITAVVRRVARDKVAGMTLNYESVKGYVNADYFNIPEGDGWHELTWQVTDANFVGGWGWHFRLNAISSPNEFLIREIRVNKLN